MELMKDGDYTPIMSTLKFKRGHIIRRNEYKANKDCSGKRHSNLKSVGSAVSQAAHGPVSAARDMMRTKTK